LFQPCTYVQSGLKKKPKNSWGGRRRKKKFFLTVGEP
jgi:hypothetical protein